ncbi:ribonuclease III [Clostridium akagii]|uniref:ribonuclease III n=1 Tax=Clostridium akagii TaxID=91623 RepID=UPI00047BD6B2|nr:ribonuclease III [Clostridium akagii]
MNNDCLDELQKKLTVNFENKQLLITAITHSSYANQKKNVKYNERLEFLGDAVLQIVISEYLFLNYEDKSEGELSKKRSLIVCENSLFKIAKQWELGNYILMSNGEEMTGGRTRVSILSDCVEAIIAAIYLDKGIENSKEFILRNFSDIIESAMKNQIILDYKTKLQEVLQKKGEVDIQYNLIKFEGPPHRRKFYISVIYHGEIHGTGSGYSKKEAEQDAAQTSLMKMDDIYE